MAGSRSSSPPRRRWSCRWRCSASSTRSRRPPCSWRFFFAAYFIAYEPYRALYPDFVDNEIAGRAQSTQAIFRGVGTFLALLGGGLLISISDPLPFLAAAAVVLACMTAFALTGVRRRRRESRAADADLVQVAIRIVDLIRCRRDLQAFLVANGLWELALAALKTFVVLYVTKTLGFSLAGSSGVIAAAALIVLVGAGRSATSTAARGSCAGRWRSTAWACSCPSRRRPPRPCWSPFRSSHSAAA